MSTHVRRSAAVAAGLAIAVGMISGCSTVAIGDSCGEFTTSVGLASTGIANGFAQLDSDAAAAVKDIAAAGEEFDGRRRNWDPAVASAAQRFSDAIEALAEETAAAAEAGIGDGERVRDAVAEFKAEATAATEVCVDAGGKPLKSPSGR